MVEKRGAKTIIDELKTKLKNKNKIKIEIQGDYAHTSNTKQTTFVLVKSNDRSDTIEVVSDSLSEMGIQYKEGRVPGSSFPGLTITNFNKIGKKEKEIRILFKFFDGADSKSYNIWNELLDKHIFPKNSNLKRQPSNSYEVNVLKLINGKIQEHGSGKPIDVKIKNKTFKNVVGFVGGLGTKKADFVGIDYDANEVCFISYKAGSSSTDFQQYSGISQRSGDSISNHREVLKFNEDVVSNWESLSSDYNTLYRKINDRDLKKKSVFGKDYRKNSGYDSVDFFVQGDPRFTLRGNVLHISFSQKTVRKGDLSGLSRDYDPVLGARTGERYRKITANNKTIRGVRGGIWSKGYIISRRKHKEI